MNVKSGFSMVEVSLALLVVSIGMISILALFPASLEMSRRAINETYAAFLADSAFASYKGAAAFVPWNELENYVPIGPNTINNNRDVFWKNSENLSVRADNTVRLLLFEATSSQYKWDGSPKLPLDWSMEDHGIRYRMRMEDAPDDPRIKQVILEIWSSQFGDVDKIEPEYFYTEIFRHGRSP